MKCLELGAVLADYHDVLSEQLHKTIKELEEIGLSFGFTSIIGDEEIGKNVQVTLYKQEPIQVPKGKRKTNFKVNTITPDRPFIHKQLAKALADHFWKEFKEGRLLEMEKQLHKENWVTADLLFSAIAEELHGGMEEATVVKTKMIAEALVESDFPLAMRSRTKEDTAEVMTEKTKIDCPEYLMFRLITSRSWDMKKIEDLQTAQQYIVKNYKHYRKIVVLRNAEAVPYTLFAETEKGISAGAAGYRYLQIHGLYLQRPSPAVRGEIFDRGADRFCAGLCAEPVLHGMGADHGIPAGGYQQLYTSNDLYFASELVIDMRTYQECVTVSDAGDAGDVVETEYFDGSVYQIKIRNDYDYDYQDSVSVITESYYFVQKDWYLGRYSCHADSWSYGYTMDDIWSNSVEQKIKAPGAGMKTESFWTDINGSRYQGYCGYAEQIFPAVDLWFSSEWNQQIDQLLSHQ